MIVHDCVQGTEEWMRLRCGIPTASSFSRIYQPVRRKPSKQRDLYLLELVDEWMHGVRDEPFENEHTRRGHELEAQARFAYGMEFLCDVQQVGFITRDDGKCGGSPDGLIGDAEIIEIKCPSPQRLSAYRDNPKHIAQCQGLLYVCERERCHLWVYNPDGDSLRHTITRDDEYLRAFVPVLDEFLEELEAAKAEVAIAHNRRSA